MLAKGTVWVVNSTSFSVFLQISAHGGCSVYPSVVRRIRVTQQHIQLEPTDRFCLQKRVSGDNPALQDPLTYRRLAVLARSWSCQPRIAARSVLNLQMRTFARMQKENEAERTAERKPALIFGAAFFNSDISEIYERDERNSVQGPVQTCVSEWVYDSQWRLKRRGILHETGLLNGLCLSADYSGMGLGPKPERTATLQGYPTVSTTPLKQHQHPIAEMLLSQNNPGCTRQNCLIPADVLL